MIITTWNLNRGDREKKLLSLNSLRSTLLALQEIGRPEELSEFEIWVGEKENQAVSVKVAEGVTLRMDDAFGSDRADAIPAVVNEKFQVLALWSKPKPTYVLNVLSILEHYEDFIQPRPTLIVGDFNANPTFDGSNPKHSQFRHIENRMADLGIVSAYHHHYGEAFGSETKASIYWKWSEDKPFHVDYVFVPRAWADHITRVEMGDFESWKSLSDHRPLTVEFGSLPKQLWQ